ncbi:hypothetical protein RPMA_11885 [Tardiphaga alba]|uniref:Uncharacterized protein n=1 Tax=Tardiphaga alba TaxID=340268 RepID=A0ABX8A824_9BRAD|nr:hypothetical protein [Tardiphaga alba]QUS39456.1 hypothetical protein RPMA_11885 [Tardiphaga alba]
MSDIATELVEGLVELAALQVKLGDILADAVVRIPKSDDLVADTPLESDREISQAEITAAAQAMFAGMLDGYDGGFQSLLRTNFPQHRIEELARAALEAAAACRKG